ncbi:recombinase family protein [Phaeobacter gallaeciensis]|uniref:recombinase family protein n=1 Tax=Phaeobacter gallaeciensis TaxID=60890 RepID=UPI00237FF748|nr:recombinase family protein [Phaeobacter gallaeciensis]MDE4276604.1 recombinase family protein [Phaeobacter gallaeciensis]MDE4301834.1 recombinase family protein [Phaeobacter gallaeciensis]MDE5187006.1 recombinase family protein [Phaeobacter gallaeciensis]
MIIEQPKNLPRKKCVVYARVSSAKQTIDGAGLSSQERSCREYAERSDYDVVRVFTDVISGRFEERPGMNSLLAYLGQASSEEHVVVVDDISRFARDVATHASLRNKITASGAKIESPNQKFGEDAGGRFIETIMAAISEHDRERNKEQSKRRSLARMQTGFWVLHAPHGYRYEKAPGGGKRLVVDEPLAHIVREALEGFAVGRFQTQAEVKRYLETKPEFPKNYNRKSEVKFDTVTAMLKNILYAGYVRFEKWGVPLTKGQHEPLITFATHQIIRDRLRERKVAPARKGVGDDFPLRGFLICEACGHPLTACWSKSHTGKKYPYYLCSYRGCPERGKSLRRENLEEQFADYLKTLVPARTTFELAKDMFRDAWDERSRSASSETRRLRAKAARVEGDVGKLVQALIDTESPRVRLAYEKRVEELEHEKALIHDAIAKMARPERPFDHMFELSMRFLASPYEIWKNGDPDTKRTLLRLVFSQPLVVNRKTGVRTGETTFPF